LSKAYGVIRRFSDDVDLTYEIRAIASDLVGDWMPPASPTQPLQTKSSPAQWPITRACSLQRKNMQNQIIDYHAAVAGGLQLVPDYTALAKLADDYQRMVDDGLFLDDAEPFKTLMEQCQAIQQKANVKPPPQ
jgi:hypothetical protein